MAFLEREEHDACGIVAWVEKSSAPTRDNVEQVLRALDQMRHRAGFVSQEGDGSGILMDIPRIIWAQRLETEGQSGLLAFQESFAVGHIMATAGMQVNEDTLLPMVAQLAEAHGFRPLCSVCDAVDPDVLGPGGRAEDVHFYQFAWLSSAQGKQQTERNCFALSLAIEEQLGVHVASLSSHSVVYKVRGDSGTLRAFFNDFRHSEFASRITIGHNRYSTNTTTSSERVQPFSLLGHNGELNTIHRLREESLMLDIQPIRGASDSQDLNRLLEGLLHRYGYSLLEAMELTFPPIINEIKKLPGHLQDQYMYNRGLFGPFAQGPAGIVSRYGTEAVFSVDALGLRPLWMVETASSVVFSSEQGVVPMPDMVQDPKPLSPGEKVYVELTEDAGSIVYSYAQAQEIAHRRMSVRHDMRGYGRSLSYGGPAQNEEVQLTPSRAHDAPREARMAAFGWDLEDTRILEAHASSGAEPIRSLGFDGPLAILAEQRQNVADFLKETVAVVTNPAIDREREIEHFSTRVVLGTRPVIQGGSKGKRRLEIQSPLLLGGSTLPEADRYRATAHKVGTQLFEDVIRFFAQRPEDVAELFPRIEPGESIPDALARLHEEVRHAVAKGATIVILDDRFSFDDGATFLDPALCVSLAHQTLRDDRVDGVSARRQVSVLVRSGAIRSLHDIAVLIGLGADALCPYLYFESAHAIDGYKGIENAYLALTKGLEKVISTLGIHELRGYDRLFSGIGLAQEVAQLLEIKSFFEQAAIGASFTAFCETARLRAKQLRSSQKTVLPRPYQLWPRIWKSAGDVAAGTLAYSAYSGKLQELEEKQPISLRHLLDVACGDSTVHPRDVDLSVADHSLPFLISSMSFGSQGETAFRAYAHAAAQLDMISLNGEGGEIKDMLGKYPKHRGHQVASGRFGVNAELCNSADLLEIKIGQGAKPGEGGHLPGSKVSVKVAAARNARQGTDLISPSNNHDIYSIEDLAQMIDELKTVNARAKIAVKVPVVPGIGTIAVGIAKAGADVITLSGFDGGTGAARAHALKHVGLPVEIGVKLAHEALLDAGLRDMVEIWADGGMKSGLDVVKMVLLGANRVGFGTMAMVAVGCTSCRACHKDTCHVGIATQIETVEQATAHGLKAFVPRDFDTAVKQLSRFFLGVAGEVREIVAALGEHSLQALVGHSERLVQTRGLDRLGLDDLIRHHSRVAYTYQRTEVRRSTVSEQSLTALLAREAMSALAVGDELLSFGADQVHSGERVIGGMLSGSVVRSEIRERQSRLKHASIRLVSGSVVGNGFAAYNARGVHLRVEGGAQDGVGKGAIGGKVIIMKGLNRAGQRVNGSVGKGLAYGAQRGLFIVQGNADARAGIRLSGADIIIGGEVKEPLDDSQGLIGARANIKGFAFEYMTEGRALVMGDPGPWICSGMTGGTVYLRLKPEVGLTAQALRSRIAKGAKVALMRLDAQGVSDVQDLLGQYQKELVRSMQPEEAKRLLALWERPDEHFMMVRPGAEQTDQDIATE